MASNGKGIAHVLGLIDREICYSCVEPNVFSHLQAATAVQASFGEEPVLHGTPRWTNTCGCALYCARQDRL